MEQKTLQPSLAKTYGRIFDVFWDLYFSSKASINSADVEGTYMEIPAP